MLCKLPGTKIMQVRVYNECRGLHENGRYIYVVCVREIARDMHDPNEDLRQQFELA
jgi:hypothetical protein